MVKLLLKEGAILEPLNNSGKTPSQVAIENGGHDIAWYLLRVKAKQTQHLPVSQASTAEEVFKLAHP